MHASLRPHIRNGYEREIEGEISRIEKKNESTTQKQHIQALPAILLTRCIHMPTKQNRAWAHDKSNGTTRSSRDKKKMAKMKTNQMGSKNHARVFTYR